EISGQLFADQILGGIPPSSNEVGHLPQFLGRGDLVISQQRREFPRIDFTRLRKRPLQLVDRSDLVRVFRGVASVVVEKLFVYCIGIYVASFESIVRVQIPVGQSDLHRVL